MCIRDRSCPTPFTGHTASTSILPVDVYKRQDGDRRFVPFAPRFEAHQGLVWRSSMPNKQTQAFLDAMERVCARHVGDDAGIS